MKRISLFLQLAVVIGIFFAAYIFIMHIVSGPKKISYHDQTVIHGEELITNDCLYIHGLSSATVRAVAKNNLPFVIPGGSIIKVTGFSKLGFEWWVEFTVAHESRDNECEGNSLKSLLDKLHMSYRIRLKTYLRLKHIYQKKFNYLKI